VNLTTYIRQELQSKKILLMTHLIAGYPSLDANRQMLQIMAEVGVDMVELQMPFSEPIADGPTFVRANQDALAAGMNLDLYFDFMQEATRAHSFPQLMMGYYNTAFRMGHDPFCRRVRESGGVGFILPDLPLEEYGDLRPLSETNELSPILLMTPTNRPQRLEEIGAHAHGFVYAVARKGVTGKKTEFDQGLDSFLARCRQVTDLPLALGFGIGSGEDLRQLQGQVEMAIVGSALLDRWEDGGASGYKALLEDLVSGRN
jgi:tryptophan synthase alpha chain